MKTPHKSARAARYFRAGKTIGLEALSTRHINERYVSWLNDAETNPYSGRSILPESLESELRYIQGVLADNTKIIFAIRLLSTGQHVGNVGLLNIDRLNRSAEIAILIGEKSQWGKGLGTEAFRLMMDYGFDTLNLHRLWMGTDSEHRGMMRVAEKLGFQLEGTFRDFYFKNGSYRDVVQYHVLNPREARGPASA